MELVAVELDRQPPVALTLDDEVDEVAAHLDLRAHAVAHVQQAPSDIHFKARPAQVQDVLWLGDDRRFHRVAEMLYNRELQVVPT